MAAKVSQVVVEAIIPSITRSPTTPTGAGVSQVAIEAIVAGSPKALISQVVIEAIVAGNPDGSHGESGAAPASTRAYGHAT